MDGFEGVEEDFKLNTENNREPMKLKDSNYACCWVLNQLEFMEGFLGETEEEVRGEGGPDTVNIAEVEISNAGDVIHVWLEGECAVEDDTQALDLMGGESVIDWNREAVAFVWI